MSNAQPTMDSLRELNTELANLWKENAEIPELYREK
jgi:hypothetical protein